MLDTSALPNSMIKEYSKNKAISELKKGKNNVEIAKRIELSISDIVANEELRHTLDLIVKGGTGSFRQGDKEYTMILGSPLGQSELFYLEQQKEKDGEREIKQIDVKITLGYRLVFHYGPKSVSDTDAIVPSITPQEGPIGADVNTSTSQHQKRRFRRKK